jgi:hypothetical protein
MPVELLLQLKLVGRTPHLPVPQRYREGTERDGPRGHDNAGAKAPTRERHRGHPPEWPVGDRSATLEPIAGPSPQVRTAIILIFVVLILASLGSALVFLIRDKGGSTRTVKALTFRVALSIVLFLLLMLGYYFGFITPRVQ